MRLGVINNLEWNQKLPDFFKISGHFQKSKTDMKLFIFIFPALSNAQGEIFILVWIFENNRRVPTRA